MVRARSSGNPRNKICAFINLSYHMLLCISSGPLQRPPRRHPCPHHPGRGCPHLSRPAKGARTNILIYWTGRPYKQTLAVDSKSNSCLTKIRKHAVRGLKVRKLPDWAGWLRLCRPCLSACRTRRSARDSALQAATAWLSKPGRRPVGGPESATPPPARIHRKGVRVRFLVIHLISRCRSFIFWWQRD